MLTFSRSKFRLVSREALEAIPVPTRDELKIPSTARDVWRPVPHAELVEGLIAAAQRELGEPADVKLAVSKTGYELIGSLTLPGYLDTPDYVPGIVFGHANDMSRALQIGVGGMVFVCSNGMLSGLWTEKRRHTGGLDVRDYTRGAMSRAARYLEGQAGDVNRLKALGMPEPERRLMQLAHKGHVSRKVAFDAYELFLDPPHKYEGVERSRWHWYNAVTDATKSLVTDRQPRALREAYAAAAAV